MTLVAGVDSSTQSCKVVVADAASGRVVRSGRAAHPEGTSVDPDTWWAALEEAIESAGGLDDVAALSVAGQQHGLVALDADGRVIRDALLWNDVRSAPAAAELVAEFGAGAWAARSGLVPVASFTVSKLRWLRDAEPENAARVAAVALPHDWLTWRLLGFGPPERSPLGPDLEALTTDRSDASGTGYWSPHAGAYDRDLFVAALGRDATLPRVLGPAEPSGRTVAHGPVPEGLVLGPGAGDNAAAALGLGVGPGDAVVSIGTSGTVFALTPSPIADDTGTVAGFADASGHFLPLVATLNAAQVLDTTARLLAVDHDGLARLALSAEPASGGVVLTPYFAGERTPNLPDASAHLSGLTYANTTRANIARAAVEGLLCGLADGLDALTSRGVRVDQVVLIGGGTRSAAVPPLAAQVFGVDVEVPAPGEYVALGAAAQAAWVRTGVRPVWALPGAVRVPADPRPEIRAAYAAAR